MPRTNHRPGSFCWFELATTDQAAAKEFYSSIFGWSINDTPIGPEEVYTIFRLHDQDAAAAYAMREEQRAQGTPPHWMLYVRVGDVNTATARAKQLGANVVVEPFDVMDSGRMSVIQDPTGAFFSMWQKNQHGGTGITGEPGTVVWADLSTPEQVKGAEFYADLFDWKMVEGESMRPAVPGSYFHIVNNDMMIGGVPPSEHRHPGTPAHWLMYFQVADCDGTIAAATSMGARVLMPTMEMKGVRKFAVLADAQGATFAIVEPLDGAPGANGKKAAARAPKPAKKSAAGSARRTPRKAAAPKHAKKRAAPKARRTARKTTRKARPAAGARRKAAARSPKTRRGRKTGRAKK